MFPCVSGHYPTYIDLDTLCSTSFYCVLSIILHFIVFASISLNLLIHTSDCIYGPIPSLTHPYLITIESYITPLLTPSHISHIGTDYTRPHTLLDHPSFQCLLYSVGCGCFLTTQHRWMHQCLKHYNFTISSMLLLNIWTQCPCALKPVSIPSNHSDSGSNSGLWCSCSLEGLWRSFVHSSLFCAEMQLFFLVFRVL